MRLFSIAKYAWALMKSIADAGTSRKR